MTRSELEKIVRVAWNIQDGGSLLASVVAGTFKYMDAYYVAIAEVATNGLEPESPTLADPYGIMVPSAADVKRAVEHLVGVAEKQDRRVHVTSGKLSVGPPFIGSHNLPHDTDWD